MNKIVLWIFFVILIGYLSLVFCDENVVGSENVSQVQSESRELFDEARTRRKHKLFHLFFGWHALAIAYWIKVKVIIVAFFLGSAVFLGLRYFWPHKCSSDMTHEGPIVYDHPPSFSAHHDHVPYSFDNSDHFEHSYDPSSFGPYSGYAGAYSDTAPAGIEPTGPPDGHSIKKRSLDLMQEGRQAPVMEEKIADLMFAFLGIDSIACRRRFICEVEFRSKLNPITSMAFRIVGRGFFHKYTNAQNTHGHANSFQECATVNPECIFVQETFDFEQDDNEPEETSPEIAASDLSDDVEKEQSSISGGKPEDENSNMEVQNEIILSEERRHRNKRRRTHRNLDKIVERLLARKS